MALASASGQAVATRPAAPSPFARRWRHLDKSGWIWLVVVAVLLLLVVNPLVRLLVVSFQTDIGAFTFATRLGLTSRTPWNALKKTMKKTSTAASSTFGNVPRPKATRELRASSPPTRLPT